MFLISTRFLRLVFLVLTGAVICLVVVPPFLPRPRYEYVMDYHYRRTVSAVLGAILGMVVEGLIQLRVSRKK
jgi:hypothetical protein